jgi:hypothetical protein
MTNDNDDSYKLAVLAALLCPDLCKTKPGEAIGEAVKLLRVATSLDMAGNKLKHVMLLQKKQKLESRLKELEEPMGYSEAVKLITGENQKKNPHLDRAKEAFVKFWGYRNTITEGEAKQKLREYEQDKKSFTLRDALELSNEHAAWKSQPKKSKGKQGKVKNPEKDERKRAHPTPMPGLKSLF